MDEVEDTLNLLEQTPATPESTESEPEDLFERLLFDSPLLQLDSFKGKQFVGRITDVVGEDLYVDYGGKFHLVVTQSKERKRWSQPAHVYESGQLVRVQVNDYEIIGRFMGDDKFITINESDGVLVGPYHGP